jgi:hypothetical protein
MSQQTLKEMFKPPFASNDNIFICDNTDKPILEVVNIGEYKWMENPEAKGIWLAHNDIAQEVAKFTASALNEKAERDFSESIRWKYVGKNHEERNMYQCPKCEQIVFLKFNFCHECGHRLLPPEEKI